MIAGVAAPNLDEPVRFRGSFFSYEFGVVDQDERHDLALLKLKLNPFEKPPVLMKTGDEEIRGPLGVAILDPRKPRDGAAVAISGYPLGQPVLVTNAGWMATTWSSETSELRPPGGPDLFRAQDVTDSYLADVEANKGNSGGPVYLAENGAVVGICIGSKAAPVQDQAGQDVTIDGHQLLYSSGLTVVVPAQYVIDLLKKNGLKWTESE